jgi:hypothetical protein
LGIPSRNPLVKFINFVIRFNFRFLIKCSTSAFFVENDFKCAEIFIRKSLELKVIGIFLNFVVFIVLSRLLGAEKHLLMMKLLFERDMNFFDSEWDR